MLTRLLSLLPFLFAMSVDAQTLSFRHILDRPGRPVADHKIAYGAHADQYGELWLPKKRGPGQVPVVILVHGGCWRADLPGPELVAFLADAIRDAGLAVWSITYRRVGTRAAGFTPYPHTFLDVAAAADKLRELAAPHALDLARVAATGHSAGGHLAMWLAARHRLPGDSPLHHAAPLRIASVVGIAAIADLVHGGRDSAHACGADTVDLLIGRARRGEAAFRDTSLPALLPLGIPTTLVSGALDGIVVPAQAQRYREAARAAGETVTLKTLDGAGHFEIIAPWTAPGAEVVRTLVEAVRAL